MNVHVCIYVFCIGLMHVVIDLPQHDCASVHSWTAFRAFPKLIKAVRAHKLLAWTRRRVGRYFFPQVGFAFSLIASSWTTPPLALTSTATPARSQWLHAKAKTPPVQLLGYRFIAQVTAQFTSDQRSPRALPAWRLKRIMQFHAIHTHHCQMPDVTNCS